MKKALMISLILVLVVLGLLTPLAVLWALNTLFPILAIPYNFWTWLSVVVLNLTWLYKPSTFKIGKE